LDIHYLGLLDLSRRIRQRLVRAEEVTEALLQRIGRYEPRLHSIALLLADSAREQARRADADIAAGLYRGPLHGVPIGVKDLLWTEGLPTKAGMELLLKDFVPSRDATVVQRLKRAGAVVIAKLQMTEGALVHHHPSIARPVNPWSAAHWTGISSSGSGVATAAGFCFGAIGTDTGGSIRMPSSANSLTGIKPTWGRVSRHGLLPVSESLDHVGPMARSAADAAAILRVIAGADPLDPTALADAVPDYLAATDAGVQHLVLGIDWKFATGGLSREITGSLEQALAAFEDLGVRIQEVSLPWSDEDFRASIPIFESELALAHAEHFPAKADAYGPWARATLQHAVSNMDRPALARAHLTRDRYKGRLQKLFQTVDFLLTPGLGQVLPTWEQIGSRGYEEGPFDPDLIRFTFPFNIAGIPTLSLPGGFTPDGLPIGLQLIGPWLAEPTLLRAAAAFQQVTDFHTRHPALA